MFDAKINKVLKPILNNVAKKLLKFNVQANSITFIGFIFGIFCFYFIINEMFFNETELFKSLISD